MELATVVHELEQLLAEEAHLLGQEVQDSLDPHQYERLSELSKLFEGIDDLLVRRRKTHPPKRPSPE